MKVINVIGTGPGSAHAVEFLAKTKLFKINVFDINNLKDNFSIEKSRELQSFQAGKDFITETTRAFGFGGTSNLWHGVITKFSDEEWKYSFPNSENIKTEIEDIYDDLECHFSKLSKPIEKKLPNIFNSPFSQNGDVLEQKHFYIQKSPLRTKSIFKDLYAKGLINLYENTVVLSMEENKKDCNLIDKINYFHDGQIKSLEGDIFIVSCGALETPRLFLQSISENTYSNFSKHIGNNLIDHPWTVLGTLKSKRPIKINNFAFNSRLLSYRASHNVKIKYKDITKVHNLQYKPYQFGNFIKIKEIMTKLIVSRSLNTWINILKKYSFVDIFSTILYLLFEKYNVSFLNFKSAIYIFMDQDGNKKSSIKLSNKKDIYGRFIPIINWHHGSQEQEEIKLVSEVIAKEFKDTNLTYMPSEICWKDLCSSSHHAGTMRAGTSPINSVIDENLKVHSKKNIYVCDLSIFPRFGNSNPTYTLSAFSRRLGKHIKHKYIT